MAGYGHINGGKDEMGTIQNISDDFNLCFCDNAKKN